MAQKKIYIHRPMKKNIFLLLTLILSVTLYASAQQTYSREEVDMKLELQKSQIGNELQEAKAAKEYVGNRLEEQDKRIDLLQDGFTNQISIFNIFLLVLGIGVPIAIAYISWRLNKRMNRGLKAVEKELGKLNKSTKEQISFIQQEAQLRVTEIKLEVEKMLRETELAREKANHEINTIQSLKKDVEKLARDIARLKSSASTSVDEIESLEKRAKILVEKLVLIGPEKPSPAMKEEIKDLTEEITETKHESEYTAEDWLLKGINADDRDDYEAAGAYYQKAIETKPGFAIAYYNWGGSLCDMAKENDDEDLYEEAAKKFKKAVQIDPEFADAYYNWGVILTNLGELSNDINQYAEAIEKYKKVIEYKPDLGIAYNNWGQALMQIAKIQNRLKTETPEIEPKFIKAYELGSPSASYNLACLYSLTNDKDKAFEWLEKFLSADKSMTRDDIETDRDFANIYNDKRFAKLLNQYRPAKEN